MEITEIRHMIQPIFVKNEYNLIIGKGGNPNFSRRRPSKTRVNSPQKK